MIDCLVLFLQGCPGQLGFTVEIPQEQGLAVSTQAAGMGLVGCRLWLEAVDWWSEPSVPQFPHHHCPLGSSLCLWMKYIP